MKRGKKGKCFEQLRELNRKYRGVELVIYIIRKEGGLK